MSIVTNIPLPSKSVAVGPRKSKYPVDEAIAAGVGAAFGIELRTKDGEVPTGEALKKLASQKQSQISSLAESRNVDLATRLIEDQETAAAFGQTAPILGVWYTSATRTVREKKSKDAPAVDTSADIPAVEGDESDIPAL